LQPPDFVVDPFNQSKADFIVRMTVGDNAIPMEFDHRSKLPVRFQALPFQAVFPAIEESAGATFGAVVPELSEGFLEDIGCVQTQVGLERLLQGASSIQTQVLAPREQRITLALDVASVRAAETFILTAPDFIQRGVGGGSLIMPLLILLLLAGKMLWKLAILPAAGFHS